MSEVLVVALIAAIPGTLAVLMAWQGQRQATKAAKLVSALEVKMDGYVVSILASTREAASSAATAHERSIAAERAAEAAVEVARVTAEKAVVDQEAAEGRTPGREDHS